MLGTPRIRHRSSQRGTALIEFALVLPMLLAVTFIVIDFTRAFYAQNLLHQAVREGARLMVVSDYSDPAQVEPDILARVRTVGSARVWDVPLTVTVAPPDADHLVTVTATGEFRWLYLGILRYVGLDVTPTIEMTASCVMRDE